MQLCCVYRKFDQTSRPLEHLRNSFYLVYSYTSYLLAMAQTQKDCILVLSLKEQDSLVKLTISRFYFFAIFCCTGNIKRISMTK